jgi:hypothetical protein
MAEMARFRRIEPFTFDWRLTWQVIYLKHVISLLISRCQGLDSAFGEFLTSLPRLWAPDSQHAPAHCSPRIFSPGLNLAPGFHITYIMLPPLMIGLFFTAELFLHDFTSIDYFDAFTSSLELSISFLAALKTHISIADVLAPADIKYFHWPLIFTL